MCNRVNDKIERMRWTKRRPKNDTVGLNERRKKVGFMSKLTWKYRGCMDAGLWIKLQQLFLLKLKMQGKCIVQPP